MLSVPSLSKGRLLRALLRHRQSPCSFSSTSSASETFAIPNRAAMIESMKKAQEFDLLVIGGGATGSGAALDAAKRGLRVLCVEREDFASGTSSRSTKLLWGGSRYLVQALVSLFHYDLRLLRKPVTTIKNFISEFKMVLNCHRERTYMLKEQPHLAQWLPIAVPLTRWLIWPPPFNYPPAALGPLGLFTVFFKFYDALSGFNCPPSHIMTPSRSKRKFPQLANSSIKYCSVFYEGTHDDARTNLAVAQTAAREGAIVLNYFEVASLVKDPSTGRATGAILVDHSAPSDSDRPQYQVNAKATLLCGGPFTDEVRKMEDPHSKPAVTGAAGIHIVLPSYYAARGIGLVDMSTSDGRFLFLLPWQGHVLVGTTDHKAEPTMRPVPPEEEIRWLLNEASRYLSPDLRLRRMDVLSAWSGIRPLAHDPHASTSDGDEGSTAGASRDHVVSHNPKSGVVFVSGGKWTTFREMAQDAVDKVINVTPALAAKKSTLKPCTTLTTPLVGRDGYQSNLHIHLVQEYGISTIVAERLARAYGGRARDVLAIAVELQGQSKNKKQQRPEPTMSNINGGFDDMKVISSNQSWEERNANVERSKSGYYGGVAVSSFHEQLLVRGYPYLEAEVIFAARHDWACHPEDVLARRTRLAFLNRDAAVKAVGRVVQLMAKELLWDATQQKQEERRCMEYLRQFGGPKPMTPPDSRVATVTDLQDVFDKVLVEEKAEFIGRGELILLAEMLNHPLTEDEIHDLLSFARDEYKTPEGKVSFEALAAWWNSDRFNPGLQSLKQKKMATVEQLQGSGTLFG